jgi:hypothetical protein
MHSGLGPSARFTFFVRRSAPLHQPHPPPLPLRVRRRRLACYPDSSHTAAMLDNLILAHSSPYGLGPREFLPTEVRRGQQYKEG